LSGQRTTDWSVHSWCASGGRFGREL